MKNFRTYGTVLIGIINICLFVLLSYRWFIVKSPSSHEIRYEDYLNLSLVLLQSILAALAIGLAVLAFVGYNAIKEAAEKRAEEAADRLVRHYLTLERSSESAGSEGAGSTTAPVNRPETVAKEGDQL